MDTYHGPHVEGLGFESGVGLSIPLVLFSSLDGVPDEDTFFRHTFLVAGFVLIAFASDSSNSLLDSLSRIPVVVHPDVLVKS
jgi:hypothetical protein